MNKEHDLEYLEDGYQILNLYNKQLLIKLFLQKRPCPQDYGVDIFGPYKKYILVIQCKDYAAQVPRTLIEQFDGVLNRYV